jgi:hypothetical protein
MVALVFRKVEDNFKKGAGKKLLLRNCWFKIKIRPNEKLQVYVKCSTVLRFVLVTPVCSN